MTTTLRCRILDDVGGAFGMGAVGGGLWHLLKGMKNSPSGARFRGGIEVCTYTSPCNNLIESYPYNEYDHIHAVHSARSTKNRWKFCSMGGTLLHI